MSVYTFGADDFLKEFVRQTNEVHGTKLEYDLVIIDYSGDARVRIGNFFTLTRDALASPKSLIAAIEMIYPTLFDIEKSTVVMGLRKEIESLKEKHLKEIEEKLKKISELEKYKSFYLGHIGKLDL